jgi:hypothetical protein
MRRASLRLSLCVLLATLAGDPASADVRSLQLHIRLNCPYGLAG